MEQEVKTYRSSKRTVKIKSPLGGFIEFVGGLFTTSDKRLIAHMDKLVKEQSDRQIREVTKDEKLPPGHDLPLRERQLVEWKQHQETRNPADSTSEETSKINAASTTDVKPMQGAGHRFTAAQSKSAIDILKAKAAENANKPQQ